MMQNGLTQELDIELSEEVAEGQYANLCIIAHSSSEFVIDFVRMMPNLPKAKVKSRIVLAPEHAKRLLISLQENIARYESTLGRINIPQLPSEDLSGNRIGEA